MVLFAAAAMFAFATPVFPYTVKYTMSYDTIYDHGQNSLNTVACSNGEYGLITAGYMTFDSLPNFPYIGGVPQVRSWNSPYCGSCWQLTYTDARGRSTSLNITAVDTGDQSHEGYSLSEEAMNYLTHDQAVNLGRAPVAAIRVRDSGCGM